MRALPILMLLTPVPAAAESCDDLIETVARVANAQVGRRTDDFADFKAADGMTLTLSCGEAKASAVGVQYRGDAPPDGYYVAFGRAGEAVTGVAAGPLEDAARRARTEAARLRHGTVPARGALVTCSVSGSDTDGLTMCAAIGQGQHN